MRAYLELIRPANVITALADILAGFAIAGLPAGNAVSWLLLATACLYAGGVVLNDFFDRRVDGVERPERPIPSGRVPARRAAWFGAALLAGGIAAAFGAGECAAQVAALLAIVVFGYDAIAKKSAVFGPPTMGACRGLNLILGMSVAPDTLREHAWIALLPFVYIWAVTALSRGEIHGGRRATSAMVLGAALAVVAALAVLTVARAGEAGMSLLPLVFILLLAVRVIPVFWRAYRVHDAAAIRHAVRAGVLSLVLLDASLAAIYGGAFYGLIVLALSLVASGLARLFAVT